MGTDSLPGLADTLNGLHRRGVTLLEQDGKLRYRAARGILTEADLQYLAARKADILPLLRLRGEAPEVLPLARGQEALWFIARSQPQGAAYNVIVAVARLRSPLDGERLRGVYQTLVNRHPALRARCCEEHGVPAQAIAAYAEVDFQEIDCSDCDEARLALRVNAAYGQPFDLDTGPLFRVRLFRRGPDDAVLLATAHHLVVDGWSVGRLADEVLRLLGDARAVLDAPAAGYAEFVHWQRDWLAGPEAARDLAYWRGRLAGDLPLLDLPQEPSRGGGAATLPFALSAVTLAALRSLARQQHCSLFSLLLAAFQVLLARHAGQTDIVTGTPVAARPRPEYHDTVGFFTNPVAIRGNLAGNPPFTQFLEQIHGHVLGAMAHQNLPFAELVRHLPGPRELRRSPVFQASFVLHGARLLGEQSGLLGFAGDGVLQFGDLRVEAYPMAQQEGQFDLVLELAEGAGNCSGFFKYNAGLYGAAAMARMAGHFAVLLAGIAADPDCPVAHLPLLDAEERRQLADWSRNPVPYPDQLSLHGLVEANVARHSTAPALACAGETLSYGELDARANRLAHLLAGLGFAPGTPVGVCLPPCPERVVSLLAVLKSGCAYLPLDPDYPAERLDYMLEDARCAAVLCRGDTRQAMRGSAARLLDLDGLADTLATQPVMNPQREVAADAIAYVIYTSGSTGRPKGVPIRHHSTVNLALAQIAAFRVTAASRVLQFAAFSFDASVSEIFMALGAGACLHLASRADLLPGPALAQTLREQRISHLTLPPSALALLPGDDLPDLAHLVVAGEACPGDLAARWRAGRRFYNAYGPTEAAVCTSIMDWDGAPRGNRPPPIGRPIANLQAHVLDAALQPVPVGVRGELYIGGAGLSPGYLNHPELDVGRFIDSPFTPGERLYRSGDLACWLEDGNLDYLGRSDQQVKVRGFRIELEEIEAALRGDPAVADAVVLANPGPDGLARLDTYLVAAAPVPDRAVFLQSLRAALEARLPRHLVPSGFALLEAFPLSPAGKVDRLALRDRADEAHRSGVPQVAPRDATEQAMAELWGRLLGVETLGVHDDFFDLGGHSLLAASLIGQVETLFGKRLPLDALFEHATVAKLARLLEGAGPVAPRSLLILQGHGRRAPLTLVHGLGGDVYGYRELAQALGRHQPVHALRAPGLEPGESPVPSIERLAGRHVQALRRQQPRGPYRLAGWSMGGVVAYEMACQLRGDGEAVEHLLLFDSYPPQVLRRFAREAPALQLAQDLGGMFGAELQFDPAGLPGDDQDAVVAVLQQARSQGLLPGHADTAHLGRLARLFLAHLAALHAYVPGSYHGKVTLLRAAATPGDLADNGWRSLCGQALTLREVPGDHYSLLRPPHVGALAGILNDCLHLPEPEPLHG